MGDIIPKTIDLTKVRLDIKGLWKWVVGAIVVMVLMEIARLGARWILEKLFHRAPASAGGDLI